MKTRPFRADLLYRGASIAIPNPKIESMNMFFRIKGIIRNSRTVYVTVEEGFTIVFARAQTVEVVNE